MTCNVFKWVRQKAGPFITHYFIPIRVYIIERSELLINGGEKENYNCFV